MKRILSVLLVLGALSASAEDSYLYWMLGSTDPYGSPADYNIVKVKGFSEGGDSGYLTVYAPDATTDSGLSATGLDQLTYGQASSGALYALLATSGAPYSSFVIELYNESQFVAQSSALDYNTALANYYIATENSLTLPQAWVPTSFATPEPNSAMLMLLGCAALCLRRRCRA